MPTLSLAGNRFNVAGAVMPSKRQQCPRLRTFGRGSAMGAFGHKGAGRSITTNNQPRPSGADIVAIALSSFKLSQSECGDAQTKKREGGGLRR
jgi:hypothetical protein